MNKETKHRFEDLESWLERVSDIQNKLLKTLNYEVSVTINQVGRTSLKLVKKVDSETVCRHCGKAFKGRQIT